MVYGVIFDLDGTLADTLDDITESGNYAQTILGHPSELIPLVEGRE